VEACQHEHVIADNPIDQAVRESAENRSASVAIDHGKGEGILCQAGDESLRGLKELIA
jgi:hypothetical protein